MTTQDADPGGRSGARDSLQGPPQAAEPALDAYGVPIQGAPPTGRPYRPSLASRSGIVSVGLAITNLAMVRYRIVLVLVCGMVSAGLGIADVVARGILSGYVAYPGMVLGALAVGVRTRAKKKMTGSETAGRGIALRAASGLGALGFLLLVIGTGHGDALNNVPLFSRHDRSRTARDGSLLRGDARLPSDREPRLPSGYRARAA